MKKLLKIRFVKFERALVAQQLEIKGIHHFVENMHTQFSPFYIELRQDGICIQVNENLPAIKHRFFPDNCERDEYLEKVIKWISEGQFPTTGKLEIGKECEVSADGENWARRIFAGKTAKQLGEPRYIALGFWNDFVSRWKYVRPIDSCLQPKIDGDVYTWEMEVAE